MANFHYNKSSWNFTKCLATQADAVPLVPTVTMILAALNQSYENMLNSNPFTGLFTEREIKDFESQNVNINYVLFKCMMQDLFLQHQQTLFVKPYKGGTDEDQSGLESSASKRGKTNVEDETTTTTLISLDDISSDITELDDTNKTVSVSKSEKEIRRKLPFTPSPNAQHPSTRSISTHSSGGKSMPSSKHKGTHKHNLIYPTINKNIVFYLYKEVKVQYKTSRRITRRLTYT